MYKSQYNPIQPKSMYTYYMPILKYINGQQSQYQSYMYHSLYPQSHHRYDRKNRDSIDGKYTNIGGAQNRYNNYNNYNIINNNNRMIKT